MKATFFVFIFSLLTVPAFASSSNGGERGGASPNVPAGQFVMCIDKVSGLVRAEVCKSSDGCKSGQYCDVIKQNLENNE